MSCIFRAHVGPSVHKVGCSLFFMKHKEITKRVAWGSYHRTLHPSGLPFPCHPRASMEEKQSAKGRSQGHWGYKGPFLSSLSLPRQEPPRGVARSHPGFWGHHQPVNTGCIHPYCAQFVLGGVVGTPQGREQCLHPGTRWSLQPQERR